MSRILLVEDSKVQAMVAQITLEDAGYTVEHVLSVDDALTICYESPPDLVVSDQELVEKSGLEMCRQMKSDVALSSIPVLIFSGNNLDKYRVAALDAGADAFLPKASPNDELLAVISRLLENSENKSS